MQQQQHVADASAMASAKTNAAAAAYPAPQPLRPNGQQQLPHAAPAADPQPQRRSSLRSWFHPFANRNVPPATNASVDVAPHQQQQDATIGGGGGEAPARRHIVSSHEITFATLSGACAGYACKKFARTAGLLFGIGFLGLQILARAQLLKVNWQRVEQIVVGRLDQNGDSKLDIQDFRIAATRLLRNLTTDLPSSAGFAAAFWVGFRYG